MINSRMLEIIQILYQENDFLTVEQLADQINVKPRTLRDLFKDNRSDLEHLSGAVLIYKNNYGYKLTVTDETLFRITVRDMNEKVNDEQFRMPVTSEGRCDWIIRHLLMDRAPVKSDDLAEHLYVSRSTLTTDLKLVREKLDHYHLNLESKVAGGLYLKGSEKDLRACTADYFFYNAYSSSTSFKDQPIGGFDMLYKDEVEQIVNKTLQKYSYKMTDVGIKNLIVHIMIALFRIKNGFVHDAEKANVPRDKHQLEFTMSEEIRDMVEEKSGIHISDDSLGYIVIYMTGSRIFSSRDENLITPETLNLVREIMTDILNEYHINFFEDLDLFTMLCTHIEPMLTRLRNHVRMRNPLLTQVREEEPLGYEMAVYTAQIIEKKYGQFVDENEIGYLALHFQLALEKRKQVDHKKILTVCASGAGASRFLMYRLQSAFEKKIERIESAGLNDLDQYDLDEFDLIITTVPLTVKTKAQVLRVEYYLSPEDMKDISRSMEYNSSIVEKVLHSFDKELFFSNLDLKEKHEIISFLCGKLSEKISIPKDFTKKVFQREELAATCMGNGIAMPHPSTLMLDETKIVVAHLSSPVLWGREKVNWVFLLGIQKERDEAAEPLIQTLYSLIKDPELMNMVQAHPDYFVLINAMRSLLAKNNRKEPESIFQ